MGRKRESAAFRPKQPPRTPSWGEHVYYSIFSRVCASRARAGCLSPRYVIGVMNNELFRYMNNVLLASKNCESAPVNLRKLLEKSGWNTRRLYDGRFEICKEVNGVSCSYRSLDLVHLYRLANKFNTDAYAVKCNL